jgi:hypothetical protein
MNYTPNSVRELRLCNEESESCLRDIVDRKCYIDSIENNQPSALNLIFLFIPYKGFYMFRQLYAIIRQHLSTF